MPNARDRKGPKPLSTREPDNTAGREANGARPLDREQPTAVTPERYPSVRRDDSVEAAGGKRG